LPALPPPPQKKKKSKNEVEEEEKEIAELTIGLKNTSTETFSNLEEIEIVYFYSPVWGMKLLT
jgi:hypothetical protein